MTNDYPHLRAFSRCSLCGGAKSHGTLACWPCFNLHHIDTGNVWAEAKFDRAEASLMTAANGQAIELLLTELYFATHPRPHSEMPTRAEAKRRLVGLGTPQRKGR